MSTQWPPKSATELRNRIIDLEAENERLTNRLARWQFIGTHDYTLRRPKHLGGGAGVVDRPNWDIDGLDTEYDVATARYGQTAPASED